MLHRTVRGLSKKKKRGVFLLPPCGHVSTCPRHWLWLQARLLPAGVTPRPVSSLFADAQPAPETIPLRPATRPPSTGDVRSQGHFASRGHSILLNRHHHTHKMLCFGSNKVPCSPLYEKGTTDTVLTLYFMSPLRLTSQQIFFQF